MSRCGAGRRTPSQARAARWGLRHRRRRLVWFTAFFAVGVVAVIFILSLSAGGLVNVFAPIRGPDGPGVRIANQGAAHSRTPTPTPRPIATPTISPIASNTPTPTPTATPTSMVRFTVIGDHGVNTPEHFDVASLVKWWEPDFIVTTGDNHYFCDSGHQEPEVITECTERYTLEEVIGLSYGEFIEAGRFWPTIGNHEYRDRSGVYDAIPYRRFFDLPGDELTYTVIEGPV